MYFKGLKISIALNFAVPIGIGMLLVNIVSVALWQKYVLKSVVDNGRSHLSVVIAGELPDCNAGSQKLREFLSHKKGAMKIDADFILYRNNSLITFIDTEKTQVVELMRRSAQTQSEIVGLTGEFVSLFGIAARDVLVASPLKGYCSGKESMGIVLYATGLNEHIFKNQWIVLVYVLVNVIILTTIGFFRMTKLVVKPLENLVVLSEDFNIKKADIFTEPKRKNEFGNVAAALQNMFMTIQEDKEKLRETVNSLEQANKLILENQDKLVDAEKFAAVGRLSAGFAHEIGNPLGIIQGYLELLGMDDINSEDRRQYSERANKELARMTRLIHQLLDLAKKRRENHSRASTSSVIYELLELVSHQKNWENIHIEVECDDFPEQVCCSEAELHQVLLNCILNSIDAIELQEDIEGRIVIACSLIFEETDKLVKIEIRDNGGGVTPAAIHSVFDPFFTTKEVGHGTGLGLSVSRSIVENCGGSIHLESENSIGGTSVIIMLPVE